MRVLVVHNRYSSRVPSGENLAVDDEVRWLREAGVDVVTHEVSNDEVFGSGAMARARQAAESVWSFSAQRRMKAVLAAVEPDLVHVHNLFPLLTASVPWAASRGRLPVVWTIHNHRPVCVIGTNFRAGHPCHLCRRGWRAPGIRYACYGGSAGASALVTAATSVFRPIARQRFTALAISEAMRRWAVGTAGLPAERVHVKYNGVPAPPPTHPLPPAASRQVFLFAGYLTDYKGVSLLLEAWAQVEGIDAELRILGDGPLAGVVEEATRADRRIKWLGLVPADELPDHLAAARAVVVPSVWEEPFGRAAAEALAFARPVITTGHGGLAEIVDDESGWVTGADPVRLAEAIVTAARSDEAVSRRAEAARVRYDQLFSPKATTDRLLQLYDGARGR